MLFSLANLTEGLEEGKYTIKIQVYVILLELHSVLDSFGRPRSFMASFTEHYDLLLRFCRVPSSIIISFFTVQIFEQQSLSAQTCPSVVEIPPFQAPSRKAHVHHQAPNH